jgi:hypothetical protein
MTKQELIDIFEKAELTVKNVAYGDFDGKELGLGEAEYDLYRTGGEDEGSNWSTIHYFPEMGLYIKMSGDYQSYDGTTFYGWDQSLDIVEPKQVTVTQYVSI